MQCDVFEFTVVYSMTDVVVLSVLAVPTIPPANSKIVFSSDPDDGKQRVAKLSALLGITSSTSPTRASLLTQLVHPVYFKSRHVFLE